MIIPNPCRGVCTFDVKWQLCLGCARTRWEKHQWNIAGDEYKLHVVEQLETRKEIFKADIEFKS